MNDDASFILERMEPGVSYEPQDLRALLPGTSTERLREIMHELWVTRQVERVGYSGWRRHRSAPPHVEQPVSGGVKPVKAEDLFDYVTFGDFFK